MKHTFTFWNFLPGFHCSILWWVFYHLTIFIGPFHSSQRLLPVPWWFHPPPTAPTTSSIKMRHHSNLFFRSCQFPKSCPQHYYWSPWGPITKAYLNPSLALPWIMAIASGVLSPVRRCCNLCNTLDSNLPKSDPIASLLKAVNHSPLLSQWSPYFLTRHQQPFTIQLPPVFAGLFFPLNTLTCPRL